MFRPTAIWRELAAFALVWLPSTAMARYYWFVADDAFISFRYARNLASGLGLRFNPGESPPVEGYSNFLWVLAESGVEALGGDLKFWAPFLSLLAASVLLWRVFRVVRTHIEASRASALVATASLGLFPPFAVWSTGGLETMPFTLALFSTFELFVLRAGTSSPVLAGLAGLTVALLRVEGIAWVVLVGAGGWLARYTAGKRASRDCLHFLAVVAAGFALFIAWRYAYYGDWVANTAHAKAGISLGFLLRGSEYAALFAITFLSPLMLFGLAFVVRFRPAVALPSLLIGLATWGFAIAVGGDFMAMGRLFISGLPYTALLLGILLQRAESWPRRHHMLAVTVAWLSIVVGFLPALERHVVPGSIREHFNVRSGFGSFWSEQAYWRFMKANAARKERMGRALAEYASPGESVVEGAAGAMGYYAGLHLFDPVGLANREVAAEPADPTRVPGHDKAVSPDFFLKYRPTYLRVLLVERKDAERAAERLRHYGESLELEPSIRYVVDSYTPPSNDEASFDEVLLVLRVASPD